MWRCGNVCALKKKLGELNMLLMNVKEHKADKHHMILLDKEKNQVQADRQLDLLEFYKKSCKVSELKQKHEAATVSVEKDLVQADRQVDYFHCPKKSGKVSELKGKLGDLKRLLNEVKEHEAAKHPIVFLEKEKDLVQADRQVDYFHCPKKSGKVSELKGKLGDLKRLLNEVKEHEAAKHPIVFLEKEKDLVQADRQVDYFHCPKKSGKFSELKGKLGDLKRLLKEVKEHEAAKHPIVFLEKEKDQVQADRLPAFTRFQYLGEPGPSKLTLPLAFKILAEQFQAMDQVVSMLHNRTEICTFSKLKVAVQNITRKNFDEKAVAQIKAVVPDAYIFRQEKNIPSLLRHRNSYQLTIEPNLQSEEASNPSKEFPKTSGGKPVFSASMLVKRMRWFRNNLLAYLKQLHKAFLATLNPPLEVSDDQLMCWHPRFQLDKVDLTPSQLPQPPDVKIYQTAKDILENQRGKLNPMVEKALSSIVEKDLMANKNNTSLASNSLQQLSSSSKSNQTIDSIKGIPPAFLAKIRAKEAKKIEECMIRKPEEDINLKIMKRLPEVIRTLRAIFVIEKKYALPLEDVCKTLEENFENDISQRNSEQHVNMLRELAPELISVVEIRRRKYLKFDKNVDVQAISRRIRNLVASKK